MGRYGTARAVRDFMGNVNQVAGAMKRNDFGRFCSGCNPNAISFQTDLKLVLPTFQGELLGGCVIKSFMGW